MTKLAENNPQGTANIADDRVLAVGYSNEFHAKFTRFDRFKCWLKYGHTKPDISKNPDVWQCSRCGKVLYSSYR